MFNFSRCWEHCITTCPHKVFESIQSLAWLPRAYEHSHTQLFFSPNHIQNKIWRFLGGFQKQTLIDEQTTIWALTLCNQLSSIEHYGS
jgi:hypothetical protein